MFTNEVMYSSYYFSFPVPITAIPLSAAFFCNRILVQCFFCAFGSSSHKSFLLSHKLVNLFALAFKWLQPTFAHDILFARCLNFSTWFTKNVNIQGTKKD